MTNRDKFRAAYLVTLTAAHAKHPEEYAYLVEGIPSVVDKMTISLATGSANIGPAIKAACRKLGIKSTYKVVKEYLNAVDDLPACARDMGCLCAGHARGNPATTACDTTES